MSKAVMSQPKKHKLIVEKDVAVPLRDGSIIRADVFRPEMASKSDGEKFPIILITGPYQKDKLWVPPPDLDILLTPQGDGRRALLQARSATGASCLERLSLPDC